WLILRLGGADVRPRLLGHEVNIFEQPPHMGYFNNPNGHGSDAFWQNVTKKANKQSFYLPQ
ncbi:MAG: hypothetical protein ACLQSX_14205, partial [Smithella sp.]